MSCIRSLIEYLDKNKKNCCTVQNLSSDKKNNIFVAKINDTNMITKYINNDKFYLLPNSSVCFVYIPNETNIFVNICKESKECIHDRIANYGFYFAGNFNIAEKDTSYVVVTNNRTIDILEKNEIKEELNVIKKYIGGKRLYKNGKMVIDLIKLKNLKIPSKNIKIDGEHVEIDFKNKEITVDNKKFNKDEINKFISFEYEDYYTIGPKLIYGIDKNHNNFFIYCDNIYIYNLLLFLEKCNCQDAILISDDKVYYGWKRAGEYIKNSNINSTKCDIIAIVI